MDNNNMYDQDKSGMGAEQQQPQFQQPYQQQGYYQQPQYQQPYQQPVQQNFYQQPYDSGLEEPVGIGEWLVTMLILMIPCVNIVMIFVWAFSSGTKKSKSNYFKASLIMALIAIALWIIVAVIAIAAGVSFSGMFY